jgi:molecular chaperone HtpG
MTETSKTESLQFKAEVRQLLNILAHSLYTEREIFLRELLSNASDALHRLQFEMLTNPEVLDPEVELAITLDFDAEARTLTVADTGIGMTREELIENLGTIAHSGAMAFLQQLEAGQRPSDIIGQFGVGFYAVFMVADEVRVTSRSHRPEAEAWTWISSGENSYVLEPALKPDRGTVIEVRLKEDAAEFASSWRLEQIVRKHSNYVAFPIKLQGRRINEQIALWRQTPSTLTDTEYADFYRQLTLDPDPPLLHEHLVTDAPVNVRSILFVPRRREAGPFRLHTEPGLKLYSRKILIQETNKDLLPDYLRFVVGVVDSEDLPLNISRETVQNDRAMRQIQRALSKRLLKKLQDLAETHAEDYAQFWREFGPFIKEGIATSPSDQDELVPLLRFTSSKAEGLIALADYVERMPESQSAIYYILGDTIAAVGSSPHLDTFRALGFEVLYLVDPLDGFMLQTLREFKGRPLQNVDDPALELPPAPETAEEAPTSLPQPDFERVLERFKTVLGERVTEVRESKVLRDNPCRLVSAESGPERDLQRVRRLFEENFTAPPKILELNRSHPLLSNLAGLLESTPEAPVIDATIEQLFANLLLLEGLHPNPAEMIPRIQQLLEAATRKG